MPALMHRQGGVSFRTSGTPKHAQQSQAILEARDIISTKTAPPQKRPGESSRPILRGESEDPSLQEQYRQVIYQLNAITAAPYPVIPSSFKPGAREGKLEPSSMMVPTSPMLMNPDFVQLAMHQCGLRLNGWGNWYQPIPRACAAFHLPPLDSSPCQLVWTLVAEEIHCALVAQLWGTWGTGRPAPLIAIAFSLSPSLVLGPFSHQSPYDLGKAEHTARNCQE